MRNFALAVLFLLAFCNLKLIAQESSNDSIAYYQGLINNPKNNSQLIAAYKFYSIKADASQNEKDTLNQINALYYLAKIQNNLGVLYESETSAVNALTLLDADTTSVIVKGISDISWDSVEELKRTTIYKVLQELLINMRKHSEASIVVLSFKKYEKKIHVSYSDNGRGCDLKMNTGLLNTENRIHSINGLITFETKENQGFKSKISVS